MDIEVKEVYLHILKALGVNSHDVVKVRLNLGMNALIDRRGKHPTLLVVGVVACKLGAAGGEEFFHYLAFLPKLLLFIFSP